MVNLEEQWRLGLDEFVQNMDTSGYPIAYQIYKDLHRGQLFISLFGRNNDAALIYSELISIPVELKNSVGFGIDRGVTYTRNDVPLGLVNLLASKSEEYRVYMCRSLGVQ